MTDAKQPAASGGESARPGAETISPGYANYVLGVLFVVYVINFIDRQVLSVFIGPIKAEFGVSDTAMGLLVGFAFAFFYTFAGIPIARLADRGNRRTIIAIGLTVWSAMTVVSGLARNFAQLALARVGVGIGEAAGTPPAHSLISDYFPPNRRATALGIYSSGVYFGSAIAYLGGGYLRDAFDWRIAFFLLGAPGLLFALVVRLTVREPPRGHSEANLSAQNATFGETLRHLAGLRSWIHLVLGTSVLSITGYGVLMWGYEFYGRVHAMSPIDIGIWMGLVVGVGGSLSALVGGAVADRLAERDAGWYMRFSAIATLLALPFAFGFLLADSSGVSLACFAPFYFLANLYVPAMHTVNQNLARLRMRATAAATLLFIVNIVGAGAGPFLVGALSDYFAARHGDEAIRYALLAIAATGFLGALTFYLSSRTLAEDTRRAHL